MKNTVLSRYPELTENDVELRDDGDGRGIYFSVWNSTKPQPTIEQIQEWIQLNQK